MTVLIVRTSRTGLHVDLVIVIFSCALKQEAELEGVAGLDPRETIGDVIDRSGGVRWIRPPAEPRKVRHIYCRDAVG